MKLTNLTIDIYHIEPVCMNIYEFDVGVIYNGERYTYNQQIRIDVFRSLFDEIWSGAGKKIKSVMLEKDNE